MYKYLILRKGELDRQKAWGFAPLIGFMMSG